MALEPEYEQTRTLGSTTGGFYPSIIEVSKKISPPTVPPDVKLAVARFQPYFDPAFFPKVCFHPFTFNAGFTVIFHQIRW